MFKTCNLNAKETLNNSNVFLVYTLQCVYQNVGGVFLCSNSGCMFALSPQLYKLNIHNVVSEFVPLIMNTIMLQVSPQAR